MARFALWITSISLLIGATAFSLRLLGGYFLADDFVQLANFARWEQQGTLAGEVMAKFAGSIDGVNGFWRPLTFATYALNYLATGADAWSWLAVNLALHTANAALVAALVLRLHPAAGVRPAAFAAVLFFAFAPGWEAVLWIACRYDTLSTFFVLLAAWWFVGGSPRKALVATALALMSKESGSVAFVLVAMIALAREISDRTPARVIAFRLVQDVWPFVLLGLAYVGLRIALFGNATGAYVGVSIDLASAQHWARLLESGAAWSAVNFPGHFALRPIAALAVAALLIAGVMSARRSPEAHVNLLAVMASLALALLLVARFIPEFDPTGLGGRLFYLPGALLAIALGLALGRIVEPTAPGGRRPLAANLLAALLIVSSVHWMWRATGDYRAAQREMQAVAEAVGYVAAASPSPPALLIVPDTFRRAAFGRNAQAGLMLAPVQRASVTDRVLVQTDAEIPEIGPKIARGLFDWLPRHSIFSYPPGNDALPGTRPVEPSTTYCWSSRERRFKPLKPVASDSPEHAHVLRAQYEAAGCG
jgi:hypothetical protein